MDKEVKFDEKKFTAQIEAADNKLKAVETAMEKKLEPKDLESMQEDITAVKDIVTSLEQIGETKLTDYVKKVQEQANEADKAIKELKERKGVKPETLTDLVKDFVYGDEFRNHCKAMQTQKAGAKFELKAAADLLTTDWSASGNTVGLPQMAIPGVTKHPWRGAPIYASVPKRTVAMDHEVKYTEEETRTDSAATKAEGSQYAQSGATWITRFLGFYDVGHFAKVTRESLEDAEYIRQEINDLLYNGLLRALEVKLLTGTGSSDISGLEQVYATDITAKPVGLAAVSNVKIADCLRAARLCVAKGVNAFSASADTNKTGYPANVALIGKSTVANMELEKDEIGRRYINDALINRVAGMSVLESEDLTESETTANFLVGDFSKAMLFLKRNLIIETGLDGNDFTYGMITLRASLRGNLLVKNLHKKAFYKGELTAVSGYIGI